MLHRASALSATVLAAALSWGTAALAGPAKVPACADYVASAGTKALYVAGSSAAEPLIKRLAGAFSADATGPLTIVYQGISSCQSVQLLSNDAYKAAASETPRDCTSGNCLYGEANYYTINSMNRTTIDTGTCLLNPAGQHMDVALSDVYAETCLGQSLPAKNFIETPGPAVSMAFVVPSPAPSVLAITDTEAYFVFGFTCGGGIQPWTQSLLHFIQSPSAGASIILSTAIGVPAGSLWGVNPNAGVNRSTSTTTDSQAVVQALLNINTDTDAQATIALLPSSILDDYRPSGAPPNNRLMPLAFRAQGQVNAYYPDSSAQTLDKRNLRNGHYPAFGYLHLYTRTGINGLPSPSVAKELTDVFTGQKTVTHFDLFQATVASHYVPRCAMTVERTADLPGTNGFPPLQPYADPAPCGCGFEATASPSHTYPNSCHVCSADTDCATGTATGVCRLGFCEARR